MKSRAMGGVAVPCHPGRPNVGLCEHYTKKPPLENVIAVEVLNGGSRKGEDERSDELVEQYGYRAIGGSDSHLVSLIGLCATRFEAEIRTHRGSGARTQNRRLRAGRFPPASANRCRKRSRPR